MATIEYLLKKHSQLLAVALKSAAGSAATEEDVRIDGASAINAFIAEAGLKIKARHEYGLAGGRIDSKYAGVIVEYKNPSNRDKIGPSLTAASTQRLINQIQSRFADFKTHEGIDSSRVFAAGTDGRYILFVRHRANAYEYDGPYEVNDSATDRLLRAILSLGANGESFTPQNLVRQFGAESKAAKDGITKLYAAICTTSNPKAVVLFGQWKLLFSEVCGYDITRQQKKVLKLAKHYGISRAKPAELLFAVHTYYSIFMKFMAAQIGTSFETLATSVVRKCATSSTPAALRREMNNLEQGSLWAQLGITNFLEGDLFSWYLAAWDTGVADTVGVLARQLDNFDPTTLSVEPEDSRDLLKMLYEHLFPRSVRHDLGEYYTADWLAEQTLNNAAYDGDPKVRVLDPACGSGTFLVAIIKRIRKWYADNRATCGFGDAELMSLIKDNVIGFDLNPLAVMASKVNFLIAVRDLLKTTAQLEIPIYLCDSIVLPKDAGISLFGNSWRLRTSVGIFSVPAEVTTDRASLAKYTELLEEAVRGGYKPDEFLARCQSEGLSISAKREHLELFAKCAQLQKDSKNGIWARIIKNAFAPLFLEKVDLVVGNPPWINWEHMPDDYRDSLKTTWTHYGLFTLSGAAGRLGGGKKDLAMLFVFATMDRFLKEGGHLAFVIVQTIFKTPGAGDGFRSFTYSNGPTRWFVSPKSVEDLSRIQVFDGATNRTAVFVAEKTRNKFSYPVSYRIWNGPSRIQQSCSLSDVLARTVRTIVAAEPVHSASPTSPWLTLPKQVLPIAKSAIGESDYTAQEGCVTALNGVYWVRVLRQLGPLAVIENLWDIGKIKVPQVTAQVEASTIVPLIRGRDVSPWVAKPSVKLLLTQDPDTRMGIAEPIMRKSYPKLYAYLKQFEPRLRRRSAYVKYFKQTDPFWSIYTFGPQHLAQHKVVWRDMGSVIQAAVVSSTTPICPEHHVMFVATDSAEEAHYVCGVLMSAMAKLLIMGYTTSTGISTHIMDVVKIPKFKRTVVQMEIADCSLACHAAAAREDGEALGKLELVLDSAAEKFFSCSKGDGVKARSALNALLVRLGTVENAPTSSDADAEEVEEDAPESLDARRGKTKSGGS